MTQLQTTDPVPAKAKGRGFIATWLAGFLLLAGFCFAGVFRGGDPSTPVVADSQPAYQTKAIQDIEKGDLVLARDEHGNDLGYKQVVEVYRRTSDHLRILEFIAKDGSTQTLKTTNEHPFWTSNKPTFVTAGELKVGDSVVGPQGELQSVTATTLELHPEGIPVFNFQVADFHTYYVNEYGARAPPVLVHNADYTPDVPQRFADAWKGLRKAERDIIDDVLKGRRGISEFNALSLDTKRTAIGRFGDVASNPAGNLPVAARLLNQARVDYLTGNRATPPGGISNFK